MAGMYYNCRVVAVCAKKKHVLIHIVSTRLLGYNLWSYGGGYALIGSRDSHRNIASLRSHLNPIYMDDLVYIVLTNCGILVFPRLGW
jgi:hypothetical protein